MARFGIGILFLAVAAFPASGQTPIAPSDLGAAPPAETGGLLMAPVLTRTGNSPPANDPPALRSEPVRPEPVRSEPIRPEPIRPTPVTEIRPVSFDPPAAPTNPATFGAPSRAASLAPRTDGAVASGRLDAPDKPVPTTDPLDDFVKARTAVKKDRETYTTHNTRSLGDWLGSGKTLLCSDRDFEYFASPVTNPFLFEDPRALTEIRPILIYQKIPSEQQVFQGGNAWFFGTQARIAFTDRISFTMNKIGLQSFNPADTSLVNSEYGLSELWLGPKFTIIRDTEAHRLLAAGATFQIPIGSDKVYQDTGNLSIVPYVSYAQTLCHTPAGALNLMANTGYSIATNHDRSDYFYASAHLDLDVMDLHRFYPLLELNYFVYTTDGQARPGFGSEGRDLANIGSDAKGSNLMTWALGGRFKISESAQIGAAFELPLMGNRDLFRYRFTMDFILRF
jgi:hypothetical protein